MKKILITMNTAIIPRNLIQTGVVDRLLGQGIEVVVVVPPHKYSHYKKFEKKNLKVIEIKELKSNKINSLFYSLMKNSVSSSTFKIRHYQSLYSQEGKLFLAKLPQFLFLRFFWYLGKIKIWRKILRTLYFIFPPPSYYTNLLKEIRPDLVFTTNFTDFSEFSILKAAKRLRIKTTGVVLSWDNLTSKVFLATFPDWLLVYNKVIKEEAVKVHDILENRVIVTGIPQNDVLFLPEVILPRKDFLQSLGIYSTPNKIILFVCSSLAASPIYKEIFAILNSIIKENLKMDRVKIIVRPYLKSRLIDREAIKNLEKNDLFVVDKTCWREMIDAESKKEIEFDADYLNHFANSLYHCDLVIGSYTTMQMEACAFDKPIININFDGFKNKIYFWSVRRIADYTHHKKWRDFGWETQVKNPQELAGAIKAYFNDKSLNSDKRKEAAQRYFWKCDGKSSERLADFLIDSVSFSDTQK